jgi:hypothetical protein
MSGHVTTRLASIAGEALAALSKREQRVNVALA